MNEKCTFQHLLWDNWKCPFESKCRNVQVGIKKEKTGDLGEESCSRREEAIVVKDKRACVRGNVPNNLTHK